MDRRRAPRSPLKAKITIRVPGVKRIISNGAYLRNIGKNGFAFATEDALVRGGLYQFEISTVDTHLDLTARIVHLKVEATYYLCGAKIEQLSFPQRSRLNRTLAPLFSDLQRRFFVYSVGGGFAVLLLGKYIFGASWGVSIVLSLVVTIGCYLLLPF
jgi:hypothetical protein